MNCFSICKKQTAESNIPLFNENVEQPSRWKNWTGLAIGIIGIVTITALAIIFSQSDLFQALGAAGAGASIAISARSIIKRKSLDLFQTNALRWTPLLYLIYLMIEVNIKSKRDQNLLLAGIHFNLGYEVVETIYRFIAHNKNDEIIDLNSYSNKKLTLIGQDSKKALAFEHLIYGTLAASGYYAATHIEMSDEDQDHLKNLSSFFAAQIPSRLLWKFVVEKTWNKELENYSNLFAEISQPSWKFTLLHRIRKYSKIATFLLTPAAFNLITKEASYTNQIACGLLGMFHSIEDENEINEFTNKPINEMRDLTRLPLKGRVLQWIDRGSRYLIPTTIIGGLGGIFIQVMNDSTNFETDRIAMGIFFGTTTLFITLSTLSDRLFKIITPKQGENFIPPSPLKTHIYFRLQRKFSLFGLRMLFLYWYLEQKKIALGNEGINHLTPLQALVAYIGWIGYSAELGNTVAQKLSPKVGRQPIQINDWLLLNEGISLISKAIGH